VFTLLSAEVSYRRGISSIQKQLQELHLSMGLSSEQLEKQQNSLFLAAQKLECLHFADYPDYG